jgi:hypothetical protein
MYTKPRFQALVVISLVVLVGLACEFSFGNGGDGEPAITSITSCKSVDADQKCEGQTDVFDGTETVYVSAQGANLSEGNRVTARWFQGTDQVHEFSLELDKAGSGYISFSLEPVGSLPPGNYAAQVFLNDSLAQTANFQVEGEPVAEPAPTDTPTEAEPTPTEVPVVEAAPEAAVESITTCNSIDGEQQCVGQTTAFAPQEIMYASVEVVDAPAGLVVKARWYHGPDLVDEFPFTVDEGGSGFIAFNLSPDEAFLPGEYGVEIYANDTLVERIELLVEGEEDGADADSPQESGAEWLTLDSDNWRLTVDHPAAWAVEDGEESLAIIGDGKTLFYLLAYGTELPAEEENQNAIESVLDNLAAEFEDFQATDIEPFNVGGLPGLTSDYAYTDRDGDYLFGSVIVATSDAANTYIIYIESLDDDYEIALNEFNGMLQSLVFK